jgi:hypothetical protein
MPLLLGPQAPSLQLGTAAAAAAAAAATAAESFAFIASSTSSRCCFSDASRLEHTSAPTKMMSF